MMQLFSPAQCVGYAAFVVGVAAFLQKSDRRLTILTACESLAYAAHFALLGNPPASASALISCVRSSLAVRTRSAVLSAVFIVINLAVGVAWVHNAAGWLPVIGSCVATVAMMQMRGIPMRLALLASTFLWLANNIVSGSIGCTMLEVTIAAANITTMVRMVRARPRPGLEPQAEEEDDECAVTVACSESSR
jgi:hypothetical protein